MGLGDKGFQSSNVWVVAEVDHDISKVGSDALWRLATFFLPKITEARKLEKIQRKLFSKVPDFRCILKDN